MLFELLSDEEKHMMEEYIDWYACDEPRKASLQTLLRIWDENKSMYLYKLLGNQLIYTTSVQIRKTTDELYDALEQNCVGWHCPGEKFCDSFNMWIEKNFPATYSEWHNIDFVKDDSSSNAYIHACLKSLLENDTLIDNVYSYPTISIQLEGMDKPFVINKGCKASKVLGQLAKMFDIKNFEPFRLAHSQVLNEKCFVGKLCLSIHPFDYITMSDNANRWSSCMNWLDNGEYRRGTVEMMNSAVIVEAYLPDSHEKFNPSGDIVWNSKKWRELFVVTPQFLGGIKGYPYWNQDLEREVLYILKTLAQQNLGWNYNNDPIEGGPGETFTVPEFDNKRYSVDLRTGEAMYNDFYGQHHQFYVNYNAPADIYINYSGPSECMCCGSINTSFGREDDLICDYCDHSARCCCCGYREDPIYMFCVNDSWYCESCYNENFTKCPICEEDIYCESMYDVYVADIANKVVFPHFYRTICEDCFEKLKSKKLIKRYYTPANRWGYRGCVDIIDYNDALSSKYIEVFDNFESKEEFLKEYKAAKDNHECSWPLRTIDPLDEEDKPLEPWG